MKRKERIIFQVSKEEKEKIRIGAKSLGLSISDYVRYKTVYGGKE